MDRSEQERYAAAVEKMMESPDGEPGNSQYFRVASYHGGPKTDHFNTQGEYCVHGYEAFPGWHRAYLLDFERTMRRADIALGGDGNIGLPYWGWDTVEINGEVFPQILREKFEKYAPDMFPPGIRGKAARLGDSGLVAPSESRLRRRLQGKGELARKTLDTAQHWQHACTRESNANTPSLESPHNSVHGAMGRSNVMFGFQSSFHPVFCAHPFTRNSDYHMLSQ